MKLKGFFAIICINQLQQKEILLWVKLEVINPRIQCNKKPYFQILVKWMIAAKLAAFLIRI